MTALSIPSAVSPGLKLGTQHVALSSATRWRVDNGSLVHLAASRPVLIPPNRVWEVLALLPFRELAGMLQGC